MARPTPIVVPGVVPRAPETGVKNLLLALQNLGTKLETRRESQRTEALREETIGNFLQALTRRVPVPTPTEPSGFETDTGVPVDRVVPRGFGLDVLGKPTGAEEFIQPFKEVPPSPQVEGLIRGATTLAPKKTAETFLQQLTPGEAPKTFEAGLMAQVNAGTLSFQQAIGISEGKLPPNWKTVADPKSTTGFTHIDLNNPANRISEAPEPTAATQITIGAEEKGEARKVGEFFGETFKTVQDAATVARTSLATLDQLEVYLEKIETGALAPTTKAISAFAQGLGITLDPNLPEAEAFEALTNRMALELRNPKGGAGMPGAMSDLDREFLQQSVPNLSKTKEGNKLLLTFMRKMAQRNIDVAKRTRTYRKKHGQIDEGFFDELDEQFSKKSMFGIPEGATIVSDKTTKDGQAVYRLPDGGLWTPD